MTPEGSKRLDNVNRKLDRLLAILEGPDMEKERLMFCAREAFRGNWEPLFRDARRCGKIPKKETRRGRAGA